MASSNHNISWEDLHPLEIPLSMEEEHLLELCYHCNRIKLFHADRCLYGFTSFMPLEKTYVRMMPVPPASGHARIVIWDGQPVTKRVVFVQRTLLLELMCLLQR